MKRLNKMVIKEDIICLNKNISTSGHGLPGVDIKIQYYLLDLVGVGHDPRPAVCERPFDGDSAIAANHVGEHRLEQFRQDYRPAHDAATPG